MKQYLIFFFFIVLISSAYADNLTVSKIIDIQKLEINGLTLEVKTADAIQWEQKDNSYTPIYKDIAKYEYDSKTGLTTLKPLAEITFNVNIISETTCSNSFYLSECVTKGWDFSLFESKNIITRKEITPIYAEKPFIEELKDLIGLGTEDVIESYDIKYTGTIKDLDPSLTLVYTTSSDIIYTNRTESTVLGARLSAPVLFMDFNTPNETGNYVKDSSLYNNFGTGTNGVFYNATGGYDGLGAYRFDGVNDYINAGNSETLSFSKSGNDIPFSISAWVYPLNNNTVLPIVSKTVINDVLSGVEYSLLLTNNSRVAFRMYSGSSTNSIRREITNPLTLNAWHHVTAIYNGNKTTKGITIYVDGIEATYTELTLGTYTGMTRGVTSYLWVGAFAPTEAGIYKYFFNGTIDQVQMFNRVLSADEVLNLYNGTLNNSNYIGKYSLQGDFKSLVFYNSTTSTYWNTTLSLADTYSPRTGIVQSLNEINLSDPNLVSYWPLDTTNGTFFVDSTGRNNGTCSGTACPNNATGISSGAMRFDGVDDYIDVSSAVRSNFSTTWSLSTWFNTDSISASDPDIYSERNSGTITQFVQLAIDHTNNKLGLFLRNNAGTQKFLYGSTISLKNWYHVVVSYDTSPNNMSMYINGVLYNSSVGFNGTATLNVATIGETKSISEGSRWNGTIDEVLIYNKSLSQSEITQIYKSGLSQHANTNVTLQTRIANNYNITDSDLVLFLALNNDSSIGENNNLFVDLAGKNNGTCTGTICPSFTLNGTVGNAMKFDGADDIINVTTVDNYNFTTNSNFTISGWIQPSTTAEVGYVITKYSSTTGWGLAFIGSDDALSFYYDGGASVKSKPIYDEISWIYVAIVKNGTNISFYKDGEFASLNNSGTISATTHNIIFGNRVGGSGASNSFAGSIDEVRVYNRSLSADEIQNLYQLGSYHINWSSDWSTATTVSDGVPITSSSSSNFMQFKANLNTNDTSVSPYILNHIINFEIPPVVDITLPYFITIPATTEINYTQGFNATFNATDSESLPIAYSINDTTNFYINPDNGNLTNNTNLAVGNYTINVSIADAVGNTNSTLYQVNVAKGYTMLNLTLNWLNENVQITSTSQVNINVSLLFGDQTSVTTYKNNLPMIITSFPYPYHNFTIDKVGLYTISASVLETANWLADTETLYVNYSITNSMPTMTNPKKVIANSSNNAVLWWVSQDNNLTVNGNLYVNGTISGCVKTLNETIGNCG